MAHKELVIAWLNDAHAMELGIAQVLERHAEEAKDHPHVHAALQRHLEQTRRHAELVKGCVERMGGETSGVKSGMASVMGAVQGMTTKLAKDELIDQETARVCREILRDEQAMAEFLFQQIPPTTIEMLQIEHAMASR
jgi:ferritin-like metal-binding protein YciE